MAVQGQQASGHGTSAVLAALFAACGAGLTFFASCSSPFLQCFHSNVGADCFCAWIDRDPYNVAGSTPVDGCAVGTEFKRCCGTQEYVDHGVVGEVVANDVPVCRCSDLSEKCPESGDVPIAVTSCDGTPVTGSGSSGPSTGVSGSCDYTKFKDYCDLGCGALSCIKFCESCDALCEASCMDDADCEALGAGVCKHSETTGQGVCTKQPTICP